jgi:hypothetical protein
LSPADAERAGEHFLRAVWGCVATCRVFRAIGIDASGRGFARAQDLFGCDAIGMDATGALHGVQVTTSKQRGPVRARQRALEALPWPAQRVAVLQVVELGNDRSRVVLYGTGSIKALRSAFLVHRLEWRHPRPLWIEEENLVAIPTSWRKAVQSLDRGDPGQ